VQHGVPLGVDVVCMTPPLLMGSIVRYAYRLVNRHT
jgi:hypothetical protein